MDANLKEGLVVGGTFVLVRPLGAGGAGEVWLASDKTLGREVAVKFCRSRDDASAHRFLDEARALASVRHHGVVPVLQFGTDDATGRPFFAMPVFKSTLKERLGEAGRLPENEVASLGISLLDAMAALHEAGVVHRDIKPSNILLDDAGKPILADPGPTGGGTREWAAPEQLSPTLNIGAAADFHALGLVLYRALTGELPPPKGVLPPDIEPPAGTLPRNIAPRPSRGWESLLVALLEPSPEERLTDIGKIRTTLVRLRRRAGARAFAKRVARPVLIVLAALALATLVLFFVGQLRPRQDEPGENKKPVANESTNPDTPRRATPEEQKAFDEECARRNQELREREEQFRERIRRESTEMSPSVKAMMDAERERQARALLEPPKRMKPRTPEEIKAQVERQRLEREALIEEYKRNHPEE